MADVAEVLKSALALGVKDRAALAERLLASLDDPDDAESERLWAEEGQRRLEGYRTGRARAVEANDVGERAVTGDMVVVGSNSRLLAELRDLNARTWAANDALLSQWRNDGAEFGPLSRAVLGLASRSSSSSAGNR